MKPKYQRLGLLSASLVMVSAGVWLVLRDLEDYTVYFYSPSQLVAAGSPRPAEAIRVGGLVKHGSVHHVSARALRFVVTDQRHELAIRYEGALPGLFREGQGVVAEGAFEGGTFVARRILAKHDEYYMPPEVAASLKRNEP